MTRLDAVNFISHDIAKAPGRSTDRRPNPQFPPPLRAKPEMIGASPSRTYPDVDAFHAM